MGRTKRPPLLELRLGTCSYQAALRSVQSFKAMSKKMSKRTYALATDTGKDSTNCAALCSVLLDGICLGIFFDAIFNCSLAHLQNSLKLLLHS